MRLPWRREKLPAPVQAALRLRSGERILAADKVVDGGYLVTTDRALHLILPDAAGTGSGEAVRLRWDLVDNATWSPPLLMVEVRRTPEQPSERMLLQLDPGSGLPGGVRDRVTASIVVNDRHEAGGGWFRVLARRNFDTGELEWRVQPGPGLDTDDPAVRAAIEERLRGARGQWEM